MAHSHFANRSEDRGIIGSAETDLITEVLMRPVARTVGHMAKDCTLTVPTGRLSPCRVPFANGAKETKQGLNSEFLTESTYA